MPNPSDIENAAAAKMWPNDRASAAVGIEVSDVSPGRAKVTVVVTADMLNGLDVCHGGMIFMLADTAMALASNAHDNTAFAATATMTWLRPAREGDLLTAIASEQETAGRTGVYDVSVTNQDDEIVGLFRGQVRHTGVPLTQEDAEQ